MKAMARRADQAESLEELLGIEGNGARLYFAEFGGMLKVNEEEDVKFSFDFTTRNRRPPRDPVNALLSLGYSMLSKDFTIACYAVGFDPMMGFYHQPRYGRPALALDLMEPFRPLIVDSAVLQAINTRMITDRDSFQPAGPCLSGQRAAEAFIKLMKDEWIRSSPIPYLTIASPIEGCWRCRHDFLQNMWRAAFPIIRCS